MRKRLLFLSCLAALTFAGCSQNENIAGSDNPDENGTKNYLTVNLVATSNLGTRAEPTGDNQYEDGSQNENAVTSVRFYFFDASGNAAPVNGNNNYCVWTPAIDNSEEKDSPNVEKIFTATLSIDSSSEPASVVAVINPVNEIEAETVGSLANLNDIIKDFGGATTSFLMSNSVYKSTAGEKMEEVSVIGHIFPTTDAARKSPVTIYVERVLAKVRLGVGINSGITGGGTTIYPTAAPGQEQYDGSDIYVKFLGWNITAKGDKSRLMKEINPAWEDKLFGNEELWNYVPYFRSFWAINPATLGYVYGDFNSDANNASKFTAFDGTECAYVQENAAKNNEGEDTGTPTKVIIAAQLVDKNGKVMTFAEHAGRRYTVDGLKNTYLGSISFWKETDNGRVQIGADDIEFKTAQDVGKADKDTPGRYYVFAQLTDEAAGKTWYASQSETDTEKVDAADIDQALINLGHAKIWKEGYTYYYFDIKHLGSNGKGEHGVVRNHIYDATITKIAGLGTPVYDPDEVIYPEKPDKDDEEQYISAKINILSWRVVPNNVELEW